MNERDIHGLLKQTRYLRNTRKTANERRLLKRVSAKLTRRNARAELANVSPADIQPEREPLRQDCPLERVHFRIWQADLTGPGMLGYRMRTGAFVMR